MHFLVGLVLPRVWSGQGAVPREEEAGHPAVPRHACGQGPPGLGTHDREVGCQERLERQVPPLSVSQTPVLPSLLPANPTQRALALV